MTFGSIRSGRWVAALLLVASALWVGACSEGGTAPPQNGDGNGDDTDVVQITLTTGLRFSPAQVTISPGTTVRWVNAASIEHTITPSEHTEWERQEMRDANQTFEHTFDSAGEFDYFCEPHLAEGMTGSITVE